MSRLVDRTLRVVLTGVHSLLKAVWFVRRPRTFGAHAIALTPEQKIVLVKLRYASGWRLPGGGRSEDEPPAEAALRELREEIGLLSYGDVALARDFQEPTDFKQDVASIIIIREVRYRPPRWNWEVEAIEEADLDALPSPMSPTSASWIETLRPQL